MAAEAPSSLTSPICNPLPSGRGRWSVFAGKLDDQGDLVLVVEKRSGIFQFFGRHVEGFEDFRVTGHQHRVAAPDFGLLGAIALTVLLGKQPLCKRPADDINALLAFVIKA